MFICPRCDVCLDRASLSRRICWVCPDCHGDAVALPVLRDEVTPQFAKTLWRAAWELRGRDVDGLPCPVCKKGMPEIPIEVDGEPLHLDVCTRCHFVWFDPGEFERTPLPAPPPPEREIPSEARAQMAIAEVEMRHKLRSEGGLDADGRWQGGKPPEDPTQWVAGIVLGLPVEHEAPELTRRPWTTWVLTALLVATAIAATALGFPETVADWGLIPAHPLRRGGITLLTSFLLHGGALHLLSNGYFLLVFGDNVEDLLGWRQYLLLVGVATLGGDLAHIAFEPSSEIPLVGASGGISGIIAFYALCFPAARIGLNFRRFGYVRVGARTAFVLWIVFQCGLALLQSIDATGISAAAHLGGALVGLLFWTAQRSRLRVALD